MPLAVALTGVVALAALHADAWPRLLFILAMIAICAPLATVATDMAETAKKRTQGRR
jgi:hypothetical protein